MANYLLRRKGLGKTSTKAIVANSTTGLQVYRSDKALPDADIVIRWGCTANVRAKKIINEARAIHLASNKAAFRRLMMETDETLCPCTFFEIGDVPIARDGGKWIVRPQFHSQGKKLWVCETIEELRSACEAAGYGFYISEFIDKVAEYRVFVAQGRAIAVASKTPADPTAVAWNVAQGGKFANVSWGEWPLKAVKVAIKGFNLSGLDFGGVDVMVDGEGNVTILEINSAPSLTSPYRQACFAKALDYMVINGTDTIPLVERRGAYKKFIHPAVDPTAYVE